MTDFRAAPMPASDYLTDVPYPAHFHRETMPLWLSATMASLGRAGPDTAQPFTWLELGCGAGLGALVAAACHPNGRFIGIDLSPREIAQARALAAQAGLDNLQFLCEDLNNSAAAARQSPAPDCDFIVCHGVYSWVDERIRQAIHDIVRHRLKPGGVAYLAYMSQPGSAAFAAAQKLMRLHATQPAPGGADSAAKARRALQAVHALAQAGAGYFVEHPGAQREVERMLSMDDAYLAHEFLNPHWHAHHVADVMASLAAAGCDYAGSATPIENVDAISLPAGVQPVIARMRQQGAGPAALETAKDIARNQNLRRDLYQKTGPAGSGSAPHQLTADQHRAALLGQRVMLLPQAGPSNPGGQALVLSTRIGPVELPMAHVRPLLDALQQGPRSYAELARLPAYAGNPGFINALLQALAWAGWLHFVGTPAPLPAVRARVQRLQQAFGDTPLSQWTIVAEAGTAMPAQADR